MPSLWVIPWPPLMRSQGEPIMTFTGVLLQHGIQISMDGKGLCGEAEYQAKSSLFHPLRPTSQVILPP